MRVTQIVSFLALYVWSNSAKADENAYFEAYLKASISTCEVRNLTSYWEKSLHDTKIAIGEALVNKKDLTNIIKQAHRRAMNEDAEDCTFWELDFTYEDAELMGKAWGIDTYDAKLKLANYAASESFADAKKLVANQRSAKPRTLRQTGEAAFLGSKYDYCHAKMLAKAYGLKSANEAKVWVGDLLGSGEANRVEAKMSFAREQAVSNPENQCTFGETRFTYKDAEVLAGMWSTTTADAKIALRDKYLYGLEFDLEKRLRK